MGALIEQRGGAIKLGIHGTSLEERGDFIGIHRDQGVLESRYAIACASLQADRLAQRILCAAPATEQAHRAHDQSRA